MEKIISLWYYDSHYNHRIKNYIGQPIMEVLDVEHFARNLVTKIYYKILFKYI